MEAYEGIITDTYTEFCKIRDVNEHFMILNPSGNKVEIASSANATIPAVIIPAGFTALAFDFHPLGARNGGGVFVRTVAGSTCQVTINFW